MPNFCRGCAWRPKGQTGSFRESVCEPIAVYKFLFLAESAYSLVPANTWAECSRQISRDVHQSLDDWALDAAPIRDLVDKS